MNKKSIGLLTTLFWHLLPQTSMGPGHTHVNSMSPLPLFLVSSAQTPMEPISDTFLWPQSWNIQAQGKWGEQNLQALKNQTGPFSIIWRVHYPATSASPSLTRQQGVPLGGMQFYATSTPPQTALQLSYYVRFPRHFDFRRGGKLPGLFGGHVNTGRRIPDGTNGFSTRFMWRARGLGEVYAYLPTSIRHGTSLGKGNWSFRRGVWHHIRQVVILNEPHLDNGQLWVWLDQKLVLHQGRLRYRTTDKLKIEGTSIFHFFLAAVMPAGQP